MLSQQQAQYSHNTTTDLNFTKSKYTQSFIKSKYTQVQKKLK